MVKYPFRFGIASAALLLAAGAMAQPPTTLEDTEVEPIQCWWRTSASSIRVGEIFSVVLTCAVLDTVSTTVLPDQSRLDPTILQLTPFEVIGGTQAADLRTPLRRFFQYEYSLRYIGEEFDIDMALPPLSVAYRVQSRADQDAAAIESRDRQYILPAHQIRVLSLVPLTASDIRDRAPDTFGGIESRRFRANALNIASLTLFGLGAVILVWALVRAVSRRSGTVTTAARLAPDGAVLNSVTRELDEVGRLRLVEGWTPELAARAASVLRIAASYAVSGHAAQSAWTRRTKTSEGQVVVRSRLRPGRSAVVSASATAATVAREISRREAEEDAVGPALVDLQSALAAFDATAYLREPANGDLDDGLAIGIRGAAAVRRDYRLIARTQRALTQSALWTRTSEWAR
jgi:hypothetical protein